MRLPTLLPHLGPHHVQGEVDRVVAGISNDSRQITENDVFVAIQGAQSDGRRFVPGLRCAAIICEGPVQAEPGVCVITVPDARLALARAAAALAGWPAQSLPVVGITGSNGKTTTTLLLEALGTGLGWTSAILGTTGNRIAGLHRPSAHTTPEAPIIHGILREAADAGCAFAAMEVSSIGLHLRRADAIPYRVAVFTSFSRDHLDFHGTMDAYFAAKARLFSELVAEDGVAVLNGDDTASARLRPRCATTWRTRVEGEGDIVARRIEQDLRGSRAWVESPRGASWLELPLLGSFNIENALLALGAGLALGAPLDGALAGLAACPPVPGRLEQVAAAKEALGVTAVVDYAHSADALRRALQTLRPLVGAGRILTVFGCGGDRDRGKRPEMGAAATAGSDWVAVTSDNPRSEDPNAILDEIRPGLTGDYSIIPDRREAIAAALSRARPGDVVLVAGKGHETGQIIGDRVLPFDDRAVTADLARDLARPGAAGAHP